MDDANEGRGEWARELVVAPDGSRIYLTGQSLGDGSHSDIATAAYDAETGEQLWLNRYDGPGNFKDSAGAIGVSPDGDTVYAAGPSNGGGTSEDYVILAYDAVTGEELWVTRYDGPLRGGDYAVDYLRDLAVGPDGSTVYVTGYTKAYIGIRLVAPHDYQTLAIDGATGDILWEAHYDGITEGVDIPSSVALSPDGGLVYISGRSPTGTGWDTVTVAYQAATGEEVWRHNIVGGSTDTAGKVVSDPTSGRIYVSSFDLGGTGTTVVALDGASGDEVWRGTSEISLGFALTVASDGSRVFASGDDFQSIWSSWGNIKTAAFDTSTGDRLWEATYSNGLVGTASLDQMTRMASSPNGDLLYVTGHSSGTGSDPERQPDNAQDFLTLAYDASTGEQVWAKRYDGPGHGLDRSYGIGVSPDGARVFVAGESGGVETGQDYAVVAYDAESGDP